MVFPRTVFVPSANRRERPEVISNLFTGRKKHIRIYFISISLRYASRSFGRFMTENRWQSARKIKKTYGFQGSRAWCGKRNTNNKTLQHRPPGTEIYGRRASRIIVVIDPGRIRNRKIFRRVRPTPTGAGYPGRKHGCGVFKCFFKSPFKSGDIYVNRRCSGDDLVYRKNIVWTKSCKNSKRKRETISPR